MVLAACVGGQVVPASLTPPSTPSSQAEQARGREKTDISILDGARFQLYPGPLF